MIIRLSTATAALLLGINLAAAQTTNLPPEPAPPAHQNAPAEIIAPPMNAGERKSPATTGQNVPTKLEPGRGENIDKPISEPSGKDATDMKGSSTIDSGEQK